MPSFMDILNRKVLRYNFIASTNPCGNQGFTKKPRRFAVSGAFALWGLRRYHQRMTQSNPAKAAMIAAAAYIFAVMPASFSLIFPLTLIYFSNVLTYVCYRDESRKPHQTAHPAGLSLLRFGRGVRLTQYRPQPVCPGAARHVYTALFRQCPQLRHVQIVQPIRHIRHIRRGRDMTGWR